VRRAALLGDAWMPFWGEWDGFVRDQSKFQRQVGQLREQSSGRQVLIAANVPVRLAGGAQTASQRTSYAPEQIDLVLQNYLDAGLEYVIWNIQADGVDDYLQQMRLVAEKLMPSARHAR
jgi:hypothetical protein